MTSVLFGSMLISVVKSSRCKSVWEWSSQPKIRGFAACDILLSGAILFSGNLHKKAVRLFKIFQSVVIPDDLFFDTKIITYVQL